MSLFVKHVADKQQFPVSVSDATVDIAMPNPCTVSSHAILVEAFRWHTWGKKKKKTRLDHVTRNTLAARNNEDKSTADSRSVQSFLCH